VTPRRPRLLSDILQGAETVQQAAASILREQGVAGFWRGIGAALFLTVDISTTFLLFDKFKVGLRLVWSGARVVARCVSGSLC
jgi:hypothetical protein